MSARALQQKRSFLEDMLDKKIASDKITVIDDPFIEKGLGSRFYDGEGLAAKKRVMIEKGVLKNYYIDNYYGKKLGMEPNSGSPSNILFEYGSRSAEEMIKDVKKGILVTGFIGGNSNSTTGDFSFGIVGQLIEKGEIVQALNEMNISGNAKDFWNKLTEVGNDPYPYSSRRIPGMMFDGIHFAGI
jgi:PmbA protein